MKGSGGCDVQPSVHSQGFLDNSTLICNPDRPGSASSPGHSNLPPTPHEVKFIAHPNGMLIGLHSPKVTLVNCTILSGLLSSEWMPGRGGQSSTTSRTAKELHHRPSCTKDDYRGLPDMQSKSAAERIAVHAKLNGPKDGSKTRGYPMLAGWLGDLELPGAIIPKDLQQLWLSITVCSQISKLVFFHANP